MSDNPPTSSVITDDPSSWPPLWRRKRNLPQYKKISNADYRMKMAAKDAGIPEAEIDAKSVLDLASALPPSLRPGYKKEVQYRLSAASEDIEPGLLLPIIEEFVFLQFLVRKQMVEGIRQMGGLDDKGARAIDLLLNRRLQMLADIGQTAKEWRLGKKKTDASVLKMIEEATTKAEAVRKSRDQDDADIATKFDARVLPEIDERGVTQESGEVSAELPSDVDAEAANSNGEMPDNQPDN